MAYTKYSLTPANNTATPPDGAPEGMLPSAVNDTMRDMMAQIRDCGDGVRDGTYTMTTPKITGGTITGAAITASSYNGTVGATTASTGAFTSITASTTLGITGVATFSAGTVALPAITTTGDTNTGIYFPAADTIAFTEGGAEAMRINSSGQVGIGTSSPGSPLTVSTTGVDRTVQINSTDGAGGYGAVLSLNNTGTGGREYNITSTSNADGGVGGGKLKFYDVTAASTRMVIDASGNVLVGASSAVNTSKFLVAGVNSSTAPVIQGSSGFGAYLNFFNDAKTTGSMQIGQGFSPGTDNVGILYNNANAALVFGTNALERMRIDSSGNLLVGTTSSIGNAGVIQGKASGAVLYLETNSSSGSQNVLDIANVSNTAYKPMRFWVNGYATTEVGSITCTTSLTSYNVTSDYRLKENITPMTGALAKVAQLKPVTYKWKTDGSDGQGFIAHELQAVVPDCVTGEKDAIDENGKPQYQAMDTSHLVATLTKAIQEQQALIESLTTRLTALENK